MNVFRVWLTYDMDHVRTSYHGDDLLMKFTVWGVCCENVYLMGPKREKENLYGSKCQNIYNPKKTMRL